MAAFINPILSVIDRLIPDRAQAAAAKANLLQMQTQGQLDKEMADLKQAATETTSAADIIKTEAASQGWLPRNVRPLLLLCWGLLVTFNFAVPVIARFWVPDFQPVALDPWVFKLTAIGFTGYVTARTWEKVTSSN